jgi:hypothetical protein
MYETTDNNPLPIGLMSGLKEATESPFLFEVPQTGNVSKVL